MRILPLGIALACVAAAGSAATASAKLEIPIAFAESRNLKFWAVHAHDSRGSIAVYGRVQRRSLMSGSVAGHLHIEAWGGGKLLTRETTRWNHLGKRRLPGATFTAKLRINPAEVSEIRVSHELASHDER